MWKDGFTVPELLVVALLTGLILAVATPPALRAFRGTATQAAIDEFITAHGLARSTAIRFGRTAELHIDADDARIWVEVDTSAAGGAKDTIGGIRDFSKYDVSLVSDRALLCFDARGVPSTLGACESGDAQLSFISGDETRALAITRLGRVMR